MNVDHLFSRITMPDQIKAALESGAHLAISVSGGKDSDAMAIVLHAMHQRYNWQGQIVLVHADTGRTEWPQTRAHIESLAVELSLPLHVCARPQGDLMARWQQRHETRPDAPPWSSSTHRFCTSDNKTTPIDTLLRHLFPTGTVICAIGLRAEESSARAKKESCTLRKKITSKARRGFTWLPIHQFTLEDIWATRGYSGEFVRIIRKQVAQFKADGGDPFVGIKASNWLFHPAYALGNDRVSCTMCVLANQNDLRNGAEYNPEHYRDLVDLEIKSGFSFRQGFWLADLRPDLLTPEQVQRLAKLRKKLSRKNMRVLGWWSQLVIPRDSIGTARVYRLWQDAHIFLNWHQCKHWNETLEFGSYSPDSLVFPYDNVVWED